MVLGALDCLALPWLLAAASQRNITSVWTWSTLFGT